MATTFDQTKLQKIRFRQHNKNDFYSVLKKRAEDYFKQNAISTYGSVGIYFKGVLLTAVYITLYAAILSDHFQLLGLLVLFGLLGITKGVIGFNIIHDALHGSYTPNAKFNRFIGYWFDLNGTSSLIWKHTHNTLHHTYTNIPGYDDDINKAILLRLNPVDKLYWFHRFQNWYAILLYSMIGLNWVFYSDYAWFWNESKNKKVPMREIVLFLILKVMNLILFLIIPLIVLSVPWWQVILGYLSMLFCGGVVISVVFQLAHIVDNVKYFEPDQEGNMEYNWAAHELYTTSNFATHNRFLTELVGGLNFQIEHHLFPTVSHVHYPAISKIVKETAMEYGLPYNEQPTFTKALRSHFRTLKKLGR